ncbi:MAG: biopolymer transporter ExbD [Nannocystaceae bacterium]
MTRAKKKKGLGKVVEADLLPVMNIMFLLIPALLMAMEFASMAAIPVSPPTHAANREEPTDPPERELEVTVTIAGDGIEVRAAETGVEVRSDAAAPTKIARTGDGDDGYDFASLTRIARELKQASPETSKVIVRAEGDVHLQTLVWAMDALRGPDCTMQREAAGDGCLLWRPVIKAT